MGTGSNKYPIHLPPRYPTKDPGQEEDALGPKWAENPFVARCVDTRHDEIKEEKRTHREHGLQQGTSDPILVYLKAGRG
jgi:hypothetical protein